MLLLSFVHVAIRSSGAVKFNLKWQFFAFIIIIDVTIKGEFQEIVTMVLMLINAFYQNIKFSLKTENSNSTAIFQLNNFPIKDFPYNQLQEYKKFNDPIWCISDLKFELVFLCTTFTIK